MAEKTALQTTQNLTGLLALPIYQKRFQDVLKDRAPSFITSILSVADSMPDVAAASGNPLSIIRSAAVAASLNLPINKSLGFAWIIPYKVGGGKKVAAFQLGYKGWVQLALRSGQYKTMNALMVYKNQFTSWDPLTETFKGDLTKEPEGKEPVGFLAYFELVNGFRKTLYKTRESLMAHGKKYSKAFDMAEGQWKQGPDAMCRKTLITMMLSKWGIMSIEMTRAKMADQAAVIGDDLDREDTYQYPDAPETSPIPQDLPEGQPLGPRQKLNQARAILFGKKGKAAVEAVEKTMDKAVDGMTDAELDTWTAKFTEAAK